MGSGSTFFVTGTEGVLGDIGGFFTGPPGDPGLIRLIASQVDAVNADYQASLASLNSAVDTLTTTWSGTAATAFRSTWYGPPLCSPHPSAPAQVLAQVSSQLSQFSTQLCDYADTLEHAQHEHWIELGVVAALTVVNLAQLGSDPGTDAAEVAAAASFAELGGLALSGAAVDFGADAISQLGADLWDALDPGFDRNGGEGVPLFNPEEAATSALSGAVSFGLLGGLGAAGGPVRDLLAVEEGPSAEFVAARTGAGAAQAPGIGLENAAAAAERNGLDLSNVVLRYEAPGAPGQPPGAFGFSSFSSDGSPALSDDGRMQITLMDAALASEPDSVATIAHELAHLTLVGPYDEEAAEAYAQQVMAGYVP